MDDVGAKDVDVRGMVGVEAIVAVGMGVDVEVGVAGEEAKETQAPRKSERKN